MALVASVILAATRADTRLVTSEAATEDSPRAVSIEQFFAPTQDDREARGCCVLLTSPEPSCAYTNQGYCAARADESGIMYEFHEVASCSTVAECR